MLTKLSVLSYQPSVPAGPPDQAGIRDSGGRLTADS